MEEQSTFTVSNKHELIALHRSLLEAQFAITPHDRDVPGSPLLASLANRVVDALCKSDPRWADWRHASKHQDRVRIVRDRLTNIKGWDTMPQYERETHVRNHLAPLVPDEQLLHSLSGYAA